MIGLPQFTFLALALGLVSGCATLADAEAAKGTGTTKTYAVAYDVVWNAVLEVVKSSDLQLVADNKERGSVLAQRATTAFSWGENVAIFIEKVGEKVATRVEVVNKRTLATNITAANWEKRIFEELDKRLVK